MTLQRHMNRGSIREGGCPMCKPVRKREYIDKSGLTILMAEGLDDYDDGPDEYADEVREAMKASAWNSS